MNNQKISDIDLNIYPTKKAAGFAAGAAIEKKIIELQVKQKEVRIIFAAAPSQNETIEYLVKSKLIDWSKVNAFNMDEYLGLPPDSDQSFSNYLHEKLFSKVNMGAINVIKTVGEVFEEMDSYREKIMEKPIDIVCLGIGENGHIAFNDPPVANFNDSEVIKVVKLDRLCRQQQVNDKCFETIEKVPEKAVTLTVPSLMGGRFIYCVVTGGNKANAVKCTLSGPVAEACPASILRTHPHCEFYLDEAAYSKTKL